MKTKQQREELRIESEKLSLERAKIAYTKLLKAREKEAKEKHVPREYTMDNLNDIIDQLKGKTNYFGDMSDLGNDIGVVVGKVYQNMTKEDIDDFISGFKHGVSLTNGTH